MPKLSPPSSGLRIIHFGPVYGPHRNIIRVLQRRDHDNEHIFRIPFTERVYYRRQEAKNVLGVTEGQVDLHRRLQMDRADIVRTVRQVDPDLVIFHNDQLARLGTYGLYGTRTWMHAHRYDSMPIQRGIIRRFAYARISLWFVPTVGARSALEATGISRERIRVLSPPFDTFTARNRLQVRNEFGIPADAKVITIHEPDEEELTLLTPVIHALQAAESGYTLLVSNPSNVTASTFSALAEATENQVLVVQPLFTSSQTFTADTEGPATLSTNQSLIPTGVIGEAAEAQHDSVFTDSEHYLESIVGVSDAVLSLNWDNGIGVKEIAVIAMQAGVEVIASQSENSAEVLGQDGIYLADTNPISIHQALVGFTPNAARQQRLVNRAATVFGVDNIDNYVQAYGSMSPYRSQSRVLAAP